MIRTLVLLLVATILALPNQAQYRPITTLPQLTDSIQQLMKQEHIPGLMLVLTTRDSVLFAGGLGQANLATRQPVTAHTLFRIGSVTKTFIALGLLQLIEQGKLKLDDDVQKIAPEVPIDNPWQATDPVRVVHLLEHTAGFNDMRLNHFLNHTPTDLQGLASVELFRSQLRCRWRPGERVAYANTGYMVAGYLLEKQSGQFYQNYLTQHLVRPLDMPDANPTPRPAGLPQLAQGYNYRDGQYDALPPLALYTSAAGSMNASAADMSCLIQFFLRDGRSADGTAVVSPASLRTMETVHSSLAARNGLASGYGLANFPLITGNAPFWGHDGLVPGFATRMFYNRSLGVGYAVSVNTNSGSVRIDRLIRDFLLREVPPATRPAALALRATQTADYLGHYQYESPRFELDFLSHLLGVSSLEQHGSQLLLVPLLGQPDTLQATSPRTFRKSSELVASTLLARDPEGRRVIIAPQRDYYAVEAGFWWWLRPVLLAISSVLVVTGSLTGILWLGYALWGRLAWGQVLPRVLPLLGDLGLLATFWAFERSYWPYWNLLGQLNLYTVLLFTGPLLLSLCTLVGLGLLLRRFSQFRSRLAAWYLLLVYGGLVFWVAVLGLYGWIGTPMWSV